jgi:hypothetical protein
LEILAMSRAVTWQRVEVLRGEPGPSPLVLEFVKGVLGVASLAVESNQLGGFVGQGGHQNDVVGGEQFHGKFAASGEDRQSGFGRLGVVGLSAAARDDHPAFAAPFGKTQIAFDALVALPAIDPTAFLFLVIISARDRDTKPGRRYPERRVCG